MCAHPQLPLDMCQLLGTAALEDIACETLDEREPLHFLAAIQVQQLPFLDHSLDNAVGQLHC